MSKRPDVTVYTDGACKGNPGPGGWAAICIHEKDGRVIEQELLGSHPNTTNNRMELTAVVESLRSLSSPSIVTLFSDSAYIVNAMNQGWTDNWRRNGWRTASKDPVKNRDLWEDIIALCRIHTVRFEKVKGHSGVHYNERVDRLANLALE